MPECDMTLSLEKLEKKLRTACRECLHPEDYRLSMTALSLARVAHAEQRRKHGAPYLVHPIRVALIVISEFEIRDGDSVAAALLHDVLEDAPDRVSAETIETACGADVLRLVEILTSPPKSAFPEKAERNRSKAEKAFFRVESGALRQAR